MSSADVVADVVLAVMLAVLVAVASAVFTWLRCDSRRHKELDQLRAEQRERDQQSKRERQDADQEERLRSLERWKREVDTLLAKGRSEAT